LNYDNGLSMPLRDGNSSVESQVVPSFYTGQPFADKRCQPCRSSARAI